MNVPTPNRATRLAAFKRVLAIAASRPATSPALDTYHAAGTDAERRVAYLALTSSDRDAIAANARAVVDAQMKLLIIERRADDAALKGHFKANDAVVEAEENARVAALPSTLRRRTEIKRNMRKVALVVASGVGILLIAAQIAGEIGYFAWSLVHDWIFWTVMIGANLAIFAVVMLAAHSHAIVAVVRSLPSAVRAAVYPACANGKKSD